MRWSSPNRWVAAFFAVGMGATGLSVAHAKPVAPLEFCRVYPDAPECSGALVECAMCHVQPPARNGYGTQIEAELVPDLPRPLSDEVFLLGLPEALGAVELLDADGDGFTNLEEVISGSLPADRDSFPVYLGCDEAVAELASGQDYDVCGYDPTFAFRRILLDVCGRSPSLAELDAFRAESDSMAALHEQLDTCLDTDYWRGIDGEVWSLAHPKIRPSASLKSGDDPGDINLADYTDDYNLFVYATTDDRDCRDVLLADYHVERAEDGTMTPFVHTYAEDFAARGLDKTQFVEPEFRAGMLTSRWFLMINTMFTSLPRTTAAQAYRAYLGFDIAGMQGLHSVPNEPVDYDAKDVQRAECAACHATLDPLTYPFSRYEGIGGGEMYSDDGPFGLAYLPFSYNPDRLERFVTVDGPDVALTPENGMIFGEPVANLLEWAEVAANSEAFARTLVGDFWELLIGEPPRPSESQEFTALWQGLMTTYDYRVEAMLHALIETEAYGVP